MLTTDGTGSVTIEEIDLGNRIIASGLIDLKRGRLKSTTHARASPGEGAVSCGDRERSVHRVHGRGGCHHP